MSYDDGMPVVRCRTILYEVVQRRTIPDEVVRRRRTTIAQISYDVPRRRKMSCDVVRHRTIILMYPTLTRITANFWTWHPIDFFMSTNWLYIYFVDHRLYFIIIWSRDTRLTILIIFCGWISQYNLSIAKDGNNLSVLILNLLRIRDVIIYNLMTLHSYHNTCGNIWKITGQFTQVKCSASKVCQWIFSNSFKHAYITGPIYYNRNNLGFLPGLCVK